ncbi:MAG TPA: DUF5995 family protein [Opitutaceae bacterium]|nr:DUF5995 family protein [Opitutaceae bacterium]
MQAGSIDEVIAGLDSIIEVSRKRGTADGYFAALYRRVTAEVKERIARGGFQDGPRMERLDVVFANRYLDAWSRRERGERITESWNEALDCSGHFWPVVLQHLLLGMNAHINLDLGIAAATVSPGSEIHGLKRDFDSINAILAEMTGDVQDRLAHVWPAMRWLDRSAGGVDEAIINFSIRRARDHAWSVALAFAAMDLENARAAHVLRTDANMAALGRRVRRPGLKLAIMLGFIRLRERGSVSEKLDILLR